MLEEWRGDFAVARGSGVLWVTTTDYACGVRLLQGKEARPAFTGPLVMLQIEGTETSPWPGDWGGSGRRTGSARWDGLLGVCHFKPW